MTHIRDFEPGRTEQRGHITVTRYADNFTDTTALHHDHDEFWRFSIKLTPLDQHDDAESWIRLYHVAITNYGDDTTILAIVATELHRMALDADPDAALTDGRRLADLTPDALYATT